MVTPSVPAPVAPRSDRFVSTPDGGGSGSGSACPVRRCHAFALSAGVRFTWVGWHMDWMDWLRAANILRWPPRAPHDDGGGGPGPSALAVVVCHA